MKLHSFFFMLLMLFSGCGMNYWPETIETGFEDFEISGDSLFVKVGKGFIYSGGSIDSVAMEGKHSLLARTLGSVALEYVIENPKPDSKYLITCWTYGSGAGNSGSMVALINRKGNLIEIERQSKSGEIIDNWQMLELLVQLPPNHDGSPLVIRLENQDKNPVWFDDFKLEFVEQVYYPEFEKDESLLINIHEPDIERMREMRLEAFEKGFIDMDKESWIDAEIFWRDSIFTAKVRFKGDNLKHLQGDKWSLTIDIENGSVMGMSRFAIQTPEARSFLDEWLFHKVLQQEQLATSKYSFAPVVLNDRSLGVYALVEDQRDEEFLARFGPGAVLRFNDAAFWENRNSKSNLPDAEVFLSAEIQSIADKSIPKSDITTFEENIKLFRQAEGNTAGLFNIDKAAKMLAVCDILEAHNALHWVNVRFYGNAATGKLEFIGHDGFSAIDTFSIAGNTFLNYSDRTVLESSDPLNSMFINLFRDTTFTKLYKQHVHRISEEKYFNLLKLNTIGEMKYHRSLLVKEWPAYRFDYSRWFNRAKQLRKQLIKQGDQKAKSEMKVE